MNKNFIEFVSILVAGGIMKEGILCDEEALAAFEFAVTSPDSVAAAIGLLDDPRTRTMRLGYQLYNEQGGEALACALLEYNLAMLAESAKAAR